MPLKKPTRTSKTSHSSEWESEWLDAKMPEFEKMWAGIDFIVDPRVPNGEIYIMSYAQNELTAGLDFFRSVPNIDVQQQAPIVGDEITKLRDQVTKLEQRNQNQLTLINNLRASEAKERANAERLAQRVEKLQNTRRVHRKQIAHYQLLHERDQNLMGGPQAYRQKTGTRTGPQADAIRRLADEQQTNEYLRAIIQELRGKVGELNEKIATIRGALS